VKSSIAVFEAAYKWNQCIW